MQIGTAIAPFIVYLKTTTNIKGLPPAIFGSMIIISAIFLCFTPETKDVSLVQNVEELKKCGTQSLYERCKTKLQGKPRQTAIFRTPLTDK